MAIYEFGCPEGHVFDVNLPITSDQATAPCPLCDTAARRRVSLPAFHGSGTTALNRAVDASRATAHEPGVVSSIPSGPGAANRRATPVTRDPRHAKLPRP